MKLGKVGILLSIDNKKGWNLSNLVNSEHTHPEKRPPFRGITTQNTSIFIEKGVRIREIAQVFRSNATQPLSIAF